MKKEQEKEKEKEENEDKTGKFIIIDEYELLFNDVI